MKQIETLKFKKFCMSIGNLPSTYVDSLSYYECLMWLCKYLQETVIPTVNNNGEAVTELQNLFLQLQQYVENYFENLDVQEEINNKLDELVEDGTLETMIGHYIYSSVQSNLNFREVQHYNADFTEYEGYSHEYLQGFCKINDTNIVMGLINPYNNDNITKLIEYNIKTGGVVRYAYLELYHCNSITYNPNTGKLYVTTLESNSGGETTQIDDLIEVDYETFSISDTIQLSNLSTNRLKSVYYDVDEDQLYGASDTVVYKIDLLSKTISDIVSLDRTSIQPNSTGQVVKKYKGNYVALNISNLIFYNLDGSIFKCINIDRVVESDVFGEPEDFYIDDNGDIIVGSMKRISGYKTYRTATFYYSNIYTNTNNIIRSTIGGDITRKLTLEVDANSNQSYEDGTSTYPYKDLQKAINILSNSARTGIINIHAGTYDRTRIIGINNLTLNSNEAVTINGLTISESEVLIKNSDNNITINGIYTEYSKVYILGDSSHNIIINNGTNYNNALSAYNSQIYARNSQFIGDNNYNVVNLVRSSYFNAYSCVFDGYEGYYAIYSSLNNEVKLYGNTFNVASSATQHKISATAGSIIHTQYDLNDYNDYVKDGSSKIYGVRLAVTVTETYYGDVLNIDNTYDMVKVYFTYPGKPSSDNSYDLSTENSSRGNIKTNIWGNNISLKHGIVQFRVYNNKLTITENRRVAIDNTGTYTYEALSNNTPDTPTNFSGITKVEYYDI